MKKYISTLLTGIAVLAILPGITFAQYGQYGGTTPSQSILIDKQVGKPIFKGNVVQSATKGGIIPTPTPVAIEYVDNLTPSDVRFQPGMEIMFKIRVKNTSSIALNDVMVNDKVPSYIEPIEGPGAYDANTRIISFNAGSFNPSEERTFYFKMQWLSQDKLPTDRGLICVSNYARAYTNSTSDDDTAQACVEKQVIGVKAAPKAGPEMTLLLVAGQLGALGIGLKIKKGAKKSQFII